MNRFFSFIYSVLNWISIAISPLLIGLFLGLVIYVNYPNKMGIAIGILFGILGLAIGVTWATRVWKRHGTTEYMSTIYRSRDLDNFQESYEKDKKN